MEVEMKETLPVFPERTYPPQHTLIAEQDQRRAAERHEKRAAFARRAKQIEEQRHRGVTGKGRRGGTS
jgi:hypothetical protein